MAQCLVQRKYIRNYYCYYTMSLNSNKPKDYVDDNYCGRVLDLELKSEMMFRTYASH